MLRFSVPIWPTYVGEKWKTLGKPYGIKVLRYWEHNGEHMEILGNTIENMWKHDGNTNVFIKKFYAQTPSSPQGKKLNLLYGMSAISMVVAILLLELIPLPKSVGTY
jgi:hypothetical protein